MTSQKGFVPILILLLLTLILGGFVIYQKQVRLILSPTTNTSSTIATTPAPDIKLDQSGKFKIYTNHLDNYTFNFPSDWNLVEKHSEYRPKNIKDWYPDYINVYLSPQNEIGNNLFGVLVRNADPRHIIEINDVTKKFNLDFQSSIKKLVISNQNAFQTSYGPSEGAQGEITTKFRYGIDDYNIFMTQIDSSFINKNMNVYNQVLNTFKFTGSAPTPAPTSLQIYKDQELGISFQIPGDWLVAKYSSDALTVYDEYNREIITLQTQSPGSEINCREDPSKITAYPLGKQQVDLDLSYHCLFSEIIRVKTSTGKQFYFNFRFINIGQTDKEKSLQFLKTIEGLTINK